MDVFIDSPDVDRIRSIADLGIVDGVTTNPSLVSSTDRAYRDIVMELDKFVDGPISVEVISTDHEEMIKEAREYNTWGDDITVKFPMTKDGMKALQRANEYGIESNITLIFSVNQALIAAKNGATMVSPFVGRLDDIGHDGIGLIEDIVEIYHTYGFDTDVLAASLRHPKHLEQSAKAGADTVTLPPDVAEAAFDHPKTDLGLEGFLDDWGDRESPAFQ